jgi:hypothetical protein
VEKSSETSHSEKDIFQFIFDALTTGNGNPLIFESRLPTAFQKAKAELN